MPASIDPAATGADRDHRETPDAAARPAGNPRYYVADRTSCNKPRRSEKKELKRYLPSATANQYFAEMCRKVRNVAPLCDNVQTPEENTVTIVGQDQE